MQPSLYLLVAFINKVTATLQETYIAQIQEHSRIIHKVMMLYIFDAEEREDVYQEVLYQAWKSYPRFKGDSKFSTWLYKVALNTVLTYRRKAGQKPDKTPLSHEEIPAPAEGTHERADLLYRAISQLAETDRAIISLHLDGYSNEEIADVIGISLNNTGVKLHRIKKTLTAKLQ